MSWKPEVIADKSGKWYGNALRFETKQEAEWNVINLASRWMMVTDWRATECDDPVNYRWIGEHDGHLEIVKEEKNDESFTPDISGASINTNE